MVKFLSGMLRAGAGAAVVVAMALPLAAQAQMGDDGSPAMAMGNARMVRGTVTAAAADHLTVKTETGEVYEIAITPNTQVRKGRDPMKLADVHAGDAVGARGEIDPSMKTVHALFVTVVDAEQMKKAREAMGKTVISGTVTGIDQLKLTIKRTDDVVQVIAVDEDTSFRKGTRAMMTALAADGTAASMGGGRGQRSAPASAPAESTDSLTLADVKVGSVVAGKGAIKNGIFVPTELAIADPSAAAPRQRRRPDGTAPPGSPAPANAPTTTPPTSGTEPN